MTTTERRRNAYPGSCYVCRKSVDVGAGWLYCDTKSDRSRSRRRSSGSWAKRVKCDRCHTANISSKWQADNLDNPKPMMLIEPRPWSVAQVKTWSIELVSDAEDGSALFLVGKFGRQKISYRYRTTGEFTAPTGYALEEQVKVDGKRLSKSAAAELTPRILAAIRAVRDDEKKAAQAIVTALVAAGGVITRSDDHYHQVAVAGGTYSVWGIGGGRINDTTVEEIITRAKQESSR